MKNILFIVAFVISQSAFAQGIYSKTFKDDEGVDIGINRYTGKKLLIILANQTNPDLARLVKLNQLYSSYKKQVEFLLVATTDFSPSSDNYFTKRRIDSLGIQYRVITSIRKSMKGSPGQSEIFRLLTDQRENGKFDEDISVPWQMFAITENGRLYAVMKGSDDIESGRLVEILNAKTN